VLAGFEQRLARELGRQPMKQLMSSLRQVDGLLASWSAAAS
jgi:hypothetical protein